LAQSIYDGYLDDMCEASAAFCKRLEAQVLQAGFEERLAQNGHAHVSQPPVELTGAADEVLATQEKASQSRSQRDPGSTPAEKSDGRECSEADRPPSDDASAGQSSSDAACGMAAIASSNTENLQLDRRLLAPKLRDLADEMHKRIVDGERLIQFEVSQSRNEAGYLPRLFEFHKQLTDDWVTARPMQLTARRAKSRTAQSLQGSSGGSAAKQFE
jgi:hypothetical protein